MIKNKVLVVSLIFLCLVTIPVAESFSFNDIFTSITGFFSKMLSAKAIDVQIACPYECLESCPGSYVEMPGECRDGNLTCCMPGSCGDNLVSGDEECDGSNLNSESCESLGYYSGSLSCYPSSHEAACTFNTAGCIEEMDCSEVSCNNTAYWEECYGEQTDCPNGYICVYGDCVEGGNPMICGDGTPIGNCSVNPPAYCNNELELVDDCFLCGCPINQTCNNATGSCFNEWDNSTLNRTVELSEDKLVCTDVGGACKSTCDLDEEAYNKELLDITCDQSYATNIDLVCCVGLEDAPKLGSESELGGQSNTQTKKDLEEDLQKSITNQQPKSAVQYLIEFFAKLF